MHGLFVRGVLKRQRDSIQSLNALDIPPLYSGTGCGKDAAKSGEAPFPDTRIEISNIKFNNLNG
jgi:hypothetical protein